MANGVARARWRPLRGLYEWVMRHAEGRHAWWTMALIAFAEASFFPFPPDLVMIPMILANRRRAFVIGAWCTLFSVLGGLLGYAIGAVLYDSVGRWLIHVYGMGSDMDAFRTAYHKYGAWIMLQGLTPIPYKLVTIASGFAGFPLPLFVLFSTFTRGLRFTLVAALLFFFGDPVRVFIDKYLEIVLIVFFAVVIGGVVLARYVFGVTLS